MQQVSKRRWNLQRKGYNLRLLLLAGISLIIFIVLASVSSQLVEARDFDSELIEHISVTYEQAKVLQAESALVDRLSYAQGGSFPVENFLAYTSPFGYRRSPRGSSRVEFHKGLDIAAPEGSYIRNWWSGKVVRVSDNTACGTAVTIQSGEWKHVYCHMKGHVETDASGRYILDRAGGIKISEGQQMPSGARIGRVGMTGRTTGPHLHWGLKYGEKYIDPALVLRAMYSQ